MFESSLLNQPPSIGEVGSVWSLWLLETGYVSRTCTNYCFGSECLYGNEAEAEQGAETCASVTQDRPALKAGLNLSDTVEGELGPTD